MCIMSSAVCNPACAKAKVRCIEAYRGDKETGEARVEVSAGNGGGGARFNTEEAICASNPTRKGWEGYKK